MKIAPKAALLFALLAGVPAVATVALFLPRYGAAVRSAEERVALEAAAEANGIVVAHVDAAIGDARAMAAAIALAAGAPADRAESSVLATQAVLATRTTIDVARIEIPSKNVSMVMSKRDADPGLAPASTPELRARADARGLAFSVLDEKRGVIVVRIPRPDPKFEAPPGYVTVPLYLQGLQGDLATLAEARGIDAGARSNIVLLDAERRVIAATGTWNLAAGVDGSALPFFKILPEGATSERVEVQQDHEADGALSSLSVVSVGRRDDAGSLGWVVGIARPHEVVFAQLHDTRRLLLGIGAGAVALAIVAALLAARAVTRPVLSLVEQSRRIGRRAYREVAPAPARADEIGDLGRAMVKMAEDLEAQEKDIAREAKHKADLSRFMAPELVDAIVKGEHSLELGGRRADVTVVFADVVAFTPLAESRPPEEAVAILNELFTILTEVVFRHEGLVDKFVGDCIMAVWGAPMDQEDHAERALRAAEDMMRFVEPAAEAWKKTHDVEIRLAIGVSSGQAIVGNVGSNKRMEYTAIGDTVNIAARLEALARPNQILVAEATKALVGEAFTFRELGKERLHGRSTDTLVYELEV